MDALSRDAGFFVLIALSSMLGAAEGSLLCYIFSDLSVVWLVITLGFGLLLMCGSVGTYRYFKETEPYVSSGIRSASSTRPYRRFPLTSQQGNLDGALLDALRASRYPLERKIGILRAIVSLIRLDGKVTFEGAYRYLCSLDGSYQEDEVRDAFELLLQPLLIIKQEKDGEYRFAMNRHELRERLWLLSQVFLESSTESSLPVKPTRS